MQKYYAIPTLDEGGELPAQAVYLASEVDARIAGLLSYAVHWPSCAGYGGGTFAEFDDSKCDCGLNRFL